MKKLILALIFCVVFIACSSSKKDDYYEYPDENAKHDSENTLADEDQNDTPELPDTGDPELPDTGDSQLPDTGDSQHPDTGDTQPTDTGDTQPDGGDTQSDTGDTLPDGGDTQPDGGDTQPDGGDTQPDGGDTQPDGGDTQPDGGDTQPDSGDTQPDSGDTQPDGGDTQPDGGDTQSDSGDTQPDEGYTQPVCGNSVVEDGEGCDEGGLNGQYGHCSADCKTKLRCGDKIVTEPQEVCDEGSAKNGYYGHCKSDCSGLGERCGDGTVQVEDCVCTQEKIDDGLCSTVGDYLSRCVPVNEVCDDGTANGTWGKCNETCTAVLTCGDGIVTSPEVCDDGSFNGFYNHCKSDCTGIGPKCGDNIIQNEACGSIPGCVTMSGANEDCDAGTLNGTDDGHCTAVCTDPGCLESCVPSVTSEGWLPAMASESPDYCDGLDNDHDGVIDEGCDCAPGATQACFSGAPNRRGVGLCHDGTQTCVYDSASKKGKWGDCVNEILPSEDVCDNADNLCTGCADYGLCCDAAIDCSYDIGYAIPFNDKIINGTNFYKRSDYASATWTWTLTKGPCDELLGNTTFTVKGATSESGLSGSGTATTQVSGVGLSWFKVNFQLSGSYKLHVKVQRQNGEVHECDWVIRVKSDGLRVELCWDKTGHVDLDLHFAKVGTTSAWTGSDVCYYYTCDNLGNYFEYSLSGWGYSNTGNGHNPRLDIDNRSVVGVPENINIDNPNSGDRFRVGVNYYSNETADQWGNDPITTHPLVNIYCGGTLKATYGKNPQVSGFDDESEFWKVVEVKWVGGYDSDDCELTPKFNTSTGAYIIGAVGTYDW